MKRHHTVTCHNASPAGLCNGRGDATLRRSWKRWESGDSVPGDFYRPLIAKTLGTVTEALFPGIGRKVPTTGVLNAPGMDTLEIVSRLRRSDISDSTLDALRITAERLCTEYPYVPSEQLCAEGRQWLDRITRLLDQRLSLEQHREILTLAGWIALLVGCVEYLGVVAAREGDVAQAVAHGQTALAGERKSLPSLLMCSHELVQTLKARHKTDPLVAAYVSHLRALAG